MKKLYIGNLSYSTTEDGLRAFLADYGPIASVRIMSDKFTQQSRGFGFVELEDSAKADLAIENLDGKNLDGKTLKVNEARPQEDRGGSRPFGQNGGRSSRPSNNRSERRNSWQ